MLQSSCALEEIFHPSNFEDGFHPYLIQAECLFPGFVQKDFDRFFIHWNYQTLLNMVH